MQAFDAVSISDSENPQVGVANDSFAPVAGLTMSKFQATIKEAISLSGVGLHTGAAVTLTFNPAEEGHGFKFRRIDLHGSPIIDADVDNVIDVSRGTSIAQNGARVNTVEHALAALVGQGIDNCLIDINGPETPIMDGSAIAFSDALASVGRLEQNAERVYFVIPHNIRYQEPDRQVEIIAMPHDGFRATVMIDYNSRFLGTQHASINHLDEFRGEIANARTFCFLHELEELVKHNLVKGGDLSNAIVVVYREVSQKELDRIAQLLNKPSVQVKSDGVLNNLELHHPNEAARHKLLDVIGDLALVGMPIQGQIVASRPGHAANVAFAQTIKSYIKKNRNKKLSPQYDPNQLPIYDVMHIMSVLPHRYPFVMVDKIIEISDTHIVGVKSVSYNEPYFPGHFPDNPIMPGVLQIEAMAQTGGILALNTVPDPINYWTYFLKIDKAKFKDKVVPGDTLVFRLDLLAPIRRGVCHMHGQAFVGERMICEAELMAKIVRKTGV